MRRRWLFFCTLLLLALPSLALAGQKALLIGVDEFVSRPSAAPSSANNVQAMQAMLESDLEPPQAIVVPDGPVTTPDQLETLIQQTFAGAGEGDVSLLYISTHGVYDPEGDDPPALLLSDGVTETRMTPERLEKAFAGIGGTKVLILDACYSGAFIGKGSASMPPIVHFLGDDFKVLTSSGALESSWYWTGGQNQGQFYFTQALVEGMSADCGYPADQNSDGVITLSDLYQYLLLNHGASTPQVYPQRDDFALLRYDPKAAMPAAQDCTPVMDVTFSGTMLDQDNRQIGIEFIVTRPTQVAYQLVYQKNGEWDFDQAQLIYDGAERFLAQSSKPGAVSAGRKVRTLNIRDMDQDSYGYVLVQVVTIDHDRLNVHAGRVICIPPATDSLDLRVEADASLCLSYGREMRVFVSHPLPCALSVAVLDQDGHTVYRLSHKQTTRPGRLQGSVFYWDGRLKDQTPVAPGEYTIRVTADVNGQSWTVLSEPFIVYE